MHDCQVSELQPIALRTAADIRAFIFAIYTPMLGRCLSVAHLAHDHR